MDDFLLHVLCYYEFANVHRFNAYQSGRHIPIYGICWNRDFIYGYTTFKSHKYFIWNIDIFYTYYNVYSNNHNYSGGAR